jgi:vacuolar-type H+-ATPase subunit H
MATDTNDNKTKELFGDEEKLLIADALKTHAEKIGRKASADAPKTIKELWQAELKKIEERARKVLK